MNDVRVALAQIAPRLGDLEANLALHLEALDRAKREKADVVVFPELSLTGYVLRDMVPEVALTVGAGPLARLAAASASTDVVVGFVEEGRDHRFHNSAAYFSRGRLLHVHRKVYLPTYGMFLEGRDLAPGDSLRAFETNHAPSGILVCEDHWHLTCPWLLAQQGAEVIYTLSSSPTRGARPDLEVSSVGVWLQLLKVSAQFQTAYMVYVNRVGCEDGLIFGGGSAVVDPFGRVIAALDAVDEGVLTVPLEAEVLRRARTAYPLLRDERLELVRRELERVRRARFDLPDDSPCRDENPDP